MVTLDELMKEYNGICWICNGKVSPKNATRDHVVPKSLGGTNHRSNIKLAHASCNSKRGNELTRNDELLVVGNSTDQRCYLCKTKAINDFKVTGFFTKDVIAHKDCMSIYYRMQGRS